METYWNITPKQFEKYVEVYMQKEKERAEEMDLNNYNLGKYVAFAVNDPKRYPKRPFLQSRDEMKPMTSEEMEDIMKRNTLILGGTIK